MSGNINTFLDAVVVALAARFPAMADNVQTYRGRFSLKELGAASFKLPALRVGLAEILRNDAAGTGERDLTLRVSVAVITNDKRDLPREAAANNLAEDLATFIPTQQWNLDHAHPAGGATGKNLFTGTAGSRSLQLWEVTFEQTVRLGTDELAEDGVVLEHLYFSWSPDIGLEHKDDYRDVVTGEAPE